MARDRGSAMEIAAEIAIRTLKDYINRLAES